MPVAKEKIRCSWARSPASIAYHDRDWGTPSHDDRVLFEFLILEAAQAGLSWETILQKRENYRKAFAEFDVERVARFGDGDVERLMNDAGIVRNRLKVTSAIDNARAILALRAETGSTLEAYFWAFVNGVPIVNRPTALGELPPSTPLSEAISKDLRKRGFRFVGPTIIYSFMQAIGNGRRSCRHLFSGTKAQGQRHDRVLAHGMNVSRTLASCLALAIVVAPLFRAEASSQRLARERTFPTNGKHASALRAHPHRAFAGPGAVGSTGDVTADPLVPRPAEAPCVDTLFSNAQFATYGGVPFAYAPPAGCPGPYAKIVFNGDFSVSAGVQFDRTASISLGTVPIYFGTTAEPSGTVAPTWHVERDVTDDASLLAATQTGEADIFNIVNSTYTGIINGTAYLQFYPARYHFAAAITPDIVLPVPGVAGGPQALNTGASTLTATYALPTNVERAYLDVYSQGQQNDEFYYTCVPNDVAAELFECGNGPLRETEVSIDGTPAGAAPVTPWIFTGGLDPYLWSPIPGAQTLEFKPYRVDLTPFAALLSNGKAHTIAISVDNADQYFSDVATLFAYRDPGVKQITGAVTRNTLVANPAATVTENLTGVSPSIIGTIGVASSRAYEIAGYVNTSRGRVYTTLDSQLKFSNMQTYSNETAYTGTNTYVQTTTDDTTVSTIGGWNVPSFSHTLFSYPLSVNIATVLDATVSGTQITSIDQHFIEETASLGGPLGIYASYASNEVTPTDTLDILDFGISGNSGQTSAQTYQAFDTLGTCYTQTVKAAANVVTGVSNAPCNRSYATRVLRALERR